MASGEAELPRLSAAECAALAVVVRAQMEGRAMHVGELSPLLGDLLVKLTRAAGGAEAVIKAGGAAYAKQVELGVDERHVSRVGQPPKEPNWLRELREEFRTGRRRES